MQIHRMWEWTDIGAESRMTSSLEGMVMSVTKTGNPERGLDWRVEREE